ncbi:MAG TPA: hypothetical protein VMT35_00410 [Ignavibacteriaceae bacterium]|nr:hypothetical protein [Ignavibacteriaceae bacterium]
MIEDKIKKEVKITDRLSVLLKWKKFILINTLAMVVISTVIAFLLPVDYRATSTVMVPPEKSFGLSGLGGLISGSKSSATSIGSKLLGISSTSEDLLLGILNSRTALTKVINKFNLMGYYGIQDKNIDKALKSFAADLAFETNEYGMIEINVVNKSPALSAEISNYLSELLDSMNIDLNTQAAKNNRIFVEKRYMQNVNDLRKAEDSLFKFQKKYGIVAVPEQLEVTVKAAAEIEAMLTKKEMETFFAKQSYGESSPQYLGVLAELNLLKNKVQELKNSSTLSSTSNIFYPFKEMPDISIQYLRTFREVEIQQAILEIVMPMYEQAKVEEQKSIPTIIVVDKAVPPLLKYSPKRSLIIAGLSLLGFFIFILIIFRGESVINRGTHQNRFEEKEYRFFTKIRSFYKLKL